MRSQQLRQLDGFHAWVDNAHATVDLLPPTAWCATVRAGLDQLSVGAGHLVDAELPMVVAELHGVSLRAAQLTGGQWQQAVGRALRVDRVVAASA